MNFTNGELYGTYGKDGIPGGRGGNRPGINNGAIREGEDVFYNGVIYKGGKPGSNASSSYAIAEGGCGGGAAAGSVGGKGRNAYGSSTFIINDLVPVGTPGFAGGDGAYWVFCYTDAGYGGKGADAVKPDDAIFPGEGGHGGNGGGGAGQAGYGIVPKDYNEPYYVIAENPGWFSPRVEIIENEEYQRCVDNGYYYGEGIGGIGSEGGKGGPGAVLIFW